MQSVRLFTNFGIAPVVMASFLEDGIFTELDAFEIVDLASLGFAEARIVWKAEGVPELLHLPQPVHATGERSTEAMLGEALGNLYVGLGRFYRGEKLSAMRFIQVYAVDQNLEDGFADWKDAQAAKRDIFSVERRFEKRFPGIVDDLPAMMQDYDHTPEWHWLSWNISTGILR